VANADRIIELLHEAKAQPPGAERDRFLAEACGDDAALREQIVSLLKADTDEGESDFLKKTLLLRPTPLVTEKPGDRIGRYKLLEQIGEGGCGVVYMAEQEEPVRRRVALKVIKLGMDTKQVIARFEAERQALAMMDHPNIARVLDVGATDTGRPFFVMELVRGIKITDYCDQNKLSTNDRLDLFIQVCQAIQHAHQKGIIHRDIKPSNILVTQHDDVAVPKVIDFGIAKATLGPLTDKTVFTAFAQFLGTPAYMSPEQAQMSGLDIDTRADIYSLGVLLYELLTGNTPFNAKELLAAGMDEMRRKIREDEPAKPSTCLSTMLAMDLTTVARHRHAEPPRLIHLIRGDLDWLVMKCLEKDRTRRYETANALVMDLQRHLSNEPINARPPSRAYRLQKAWRRNQLTFAAAGAVIVALLLGVVISSWQAVRATRAMATAVAEKHRADQEASTARRVTESLQQMLGLIDPDAASRSIMSLSAVRLQVMLGLVHPNATRGPEYTLLQLVDDFANDLEGKLADQPAAAAELHATIGRAYACRGAREKARKHLRRALELGRSTFGDQHEKYADILVDYSRPDGSDPSERLEREADIRRALAIYRARGVGGEQVIRALFTLQWNLGEQASAGASAKADEIEPVLNEALAEAAKSPGVEFPKIASIYTAMAKVWAGRFQYAEAEKIARQAVTLHLKSHPDSLETGWGYFVLSATLRSQGKFAEALAGDKKALTMMRAVLPSEHANIAFTSKAVLDTLEKANDAHVLASLFPSVAELGELESIFLEVLETTKPTTLRYDDPTFLAARGLAQVPVIYLALGHEWEAAGRTTEAEESRRKAILLLDNLPDRLAKNRDMLPFVYSFSASALMKAGQPEQAKELYRKLLDRVTPRTGELLNNAAWFLATTDAATNREPTLAVELAKKAVESNPEFGGFWNTLGVARYRAGDWQQAIAELNKSVSLSKGGDSFDCLFLAMAHWRVGDRDMARQWHERASALMAKQPPSEELRHFHAELLELMK
jgi:serine/threonine protein kinase/Tfp pilus assembly protein PilF